jgi:aminoglycoside phosphotransferase (APT) family kinase protein
VSQPPEQAATDCIPVEQRERAQRILDDLGLTESPTRIRPLSGHRSSVLVPCTGANGQPFLLKVCIPPAEGRFYPPGVRLDDYPRREAAFYRYLDSTDPDRHTLPAPRTIAIDPRDPAGWILLERIPGAIGPAEEVLSMDHVTELLGCLHSIPIDSLLGRRDFPLNRWDTVSYLERIRLMYDPVLEVIGSRRWTRSQSFFTEALRWTESGTLRVVHGDFTEQNVLVDENGKPFLVDFERIGIGNADHDFAWFWIHTQRSTDWKRKLLERYFARRVGSERIRSEWGIRAALVYLALRRLRFGVVMYGAGDPLAAQNLALLDATLAGGAELFPV